jgi:Flp pilus assembly protein TadG
LAELALVTPLLILIALLLIEGGKIARVHQVLNNAAREGARLSSLPEHHNLTADIAKRVVGYAAANGVTITTANVTVDQDRTILMPDGINTSASRVAVTYTYTSTYAAAFSWLGVPTQYPLSTNAQFRNLY